MRERQPETQTIKSSEVRQQWSRLVNEVFRGETRVVVEKSGIPVAAIISADDLARFQHLEEQRQRDFQALEASWEAFDDVPPEELEREVARAIAAVRQENRQQEQRSAPSV
ncbi:MAG TPA: type II toxin-antitoxin system prevent-host-death family antitoxin [Ardenticatenaceae bacterium]|nr:type II toxin-antitoxin system prevent-host-death family antitoxin [Ardenticatenaceae bacterium]